MFNPEHYFPKAFGRSSDLLPLVAPSQPNGQWQRLPELMELTAAGTVPEFNRIPFLTLYLMIQHYQKHGTNLDII